MRLLFAVVLVVHGLIHVLGAAKGLRLADLPQLTQPISSAMGLLWLAAAILFVATAGSLYVWPRGWWALGAMAVVVSTVALVPSWADAKFGALANGIIMVGVVFGFLAHGPSSLRADYARDVAAGLARVGSPPAVTPEDIAHLPAPVQRYLQVTGVVGQPRVQHMQARMRGRIRSGPDARWMPLMAEQHNFFDPPARLFYLNASRMFIPIQGLHRYVGSSATMHVKAAALVTVARASGAEMTRAETVTMFNDMCLLAPATLIDPAIRWEAVDGSVVRAAFTNAGETIRAALSFNDAGELTNFWSDDRRQASAGGQTMTPVRWSTPTGNYRTFGPVRLGSQGDARWHEPSGEYAYIEITITDVQYNVRP
jgi:hypothetical protein